MSYGNSSRNIANLLKYDALEPIKANAILKNKSFKNPEPLLPINKQVLSFDDNDEVLLLEPPTQRKSYRMRSSRKTNDNQMNNSFDFSQTPKKDENQIHALGARLEQIVSFYDQRHNNLQRNLVERLNGLQNLVMKQMPKIDNSSMLKTDIIWFKESLQELRQKQESYSEQLQALKAKVKNKTHYKEKAVTLDPQEQEKMKVLFLQVVRVSDAIQKIQRNVGNTGQNYEARIQELEFKLRNSQKNISQITQTNSTNGQLVADLGDKVIERLQSAENNLLTLGKERIRDRQTVNQLLAQNQRVGKDMQALLRNLQGDYQNKLETKISETINRLMAQHESRINSQQQIRRNLDIRDRMYQQKYNQQKQESKARYQNMDILVRQQFQRKQDSIRMLQNLLQNEVKNMQKLFVTEAQNRKQQDNNYRSQLKRVQDNFRGEYDIFKAHQSEVLQKIGDLVKQQVQIRVNSEINLKKLTSDIATQIINDLTSVKESSQNANKKMHLRMKEVIADSSEKFNQLSHYIDDEVKKLSDVVSEKYNKMKTVFTKIAQQLKQHLTNTQSNRVNVEKRLSRLQDNFEKLKRQVSSQIDELYADLDTRLKEQKQYVQTFTFKKNNDLGIRVSKLEEEMAENFSLIKNNIQDNKQLLTKRTVPSRQRPSQESQQEMKQLRTIVFNVKSLTDQLKQDYIDSYQQLKRQIRLQNTSSRQKNYDRQEKLTQKIQKNSNQIQHLQYKNQQLANKLNSFIVDGDSNGIIATQRTKKLADDLDELGRKIKDLERQYAQKRFKDDQKQEEMKKVLIQLKERK